MPPRRTRRSTQREPVVRLGAGSVQGPDFSALEAPRTSEALDRALDTLLRYESPYRRAMRAEAQQSIALLYVVLPYPPATNNLYATVRGRRVKSAQGREYEIVCGMAVAEAIEPTEPLPLPPFRLVMHLYVPDRRKRDIEGCIKAPIDNVFRALHAPDYPIDDSMIEELHVFKHLDRTRPRLEMLLSQHRPATRTDAAGHGDRSEG